MTPMIEFSAHGGRWLAPVEDVLAVHSTDQILALPDPVPGVLGIIERDGVAVPVTETLSRRGQHVLVLTHGDVLVGVVADEVLRIAEVDPDGLRSRPAGQRNAFVGAVHSDGTTLSYVLDAAELVRAVTASTGGGS